MREPKRGGREKELYREEWVKIGRTSERTGGIMVICRPSMAREVTSEVAEDGNSV